MRLRLVVIRSIVALCLTTVLATAAAGQEITPDNAGDAIKRVFELSKRANSLADYTEVIDTCEQIAAAPVDEKKIAYAQNLAAWAYNRRGETRADQATLLAEQGAEEQAAELDSQSLADFTRSIELDPTRWKAFHNRGVGNAMQGDLEAALADFNESLKLEPEYSNTWFNRGEVHFEQGEHAKAIDDYNQALRIKPADAGALSRRGQAYAATNQFAAAVTDFTQVIRLAPQDAESYVDRAEALQNLKRWQAAADDYRQAVRLGPNSARAYREAAWFMATCPDPRFRDNALAEQAIARAIALAGQDDFRTLETHAAVLASAGQFEQAVEQQQAAIESAPNAARDVLQARLNLYQAQQPFRQAK